MIQINQFVSKTNKENVKILEKNKIYDNQILTTYLTLIKYL